MDARATVRIVPVQEIPPDWMALDIGPATSLLYSEVLYDAKTIIWNGPLGVFEMDAFSQGTIQMVHSVASSYALSIVGGGDTASDSLRSALRLGAKEVTCLYRRTEREMPGGKKDRTYAREEGARYQFLTQPIRFLSNDDGQLAAVECLRMELGEPDDSGRRRPVPVEGSNFIVEADTAVLALGYWPDPTIGDTTPDLETHNWGLILTDPKTGATTRPGVFAGGDAVTGPDLVVTAMYAGRQAAAAIDEYLK